MNEEQAKNLKLSEEDAEMIEAAFLALGRNGGNCSGSPLRPAWLELRRLCQLMESENL